MELFKLFGTIGLNGVQNVNSQLDNVTGKAQSSESKMGAAFKKIGAAVAAAFAVEKIIAFGKEIVNVAAEVSAEQSAFSQIMGDYADTAAEKMGKIADATGMVDSRLTPYMTSMTAKFKGLGYGVDEATSFASRGLNLAADAAAFWDKSLDESMGHLNSFINGSYEGGEAIGLFANDTQMAAYAVSEGIVASTKDWAALDEATKQATRLEYAENMFEMSGATGQAAKEADQYANVQANLNEKWRQFKAEIGEPLLQNVVLPAMQGLFKVVELASEGWAVLTGEIDISKSSFSGLIPIIDGVKDAIKFLETIFKPVFETMKQNIQDNLPKWKESFDKLRESLTKLAPLFELIGAAVLLAMGVIGGAINGIIGAIDGIINVFSGLITFIGGFFEWLIGIMTGNQEKIVSGWQNMGQGIIDVFVGLWETLKGLVSGLVDGIVSFFNGLSDTLVGHSIVPDMIKAIIKWFTDLPARVFEQLKELVSKVTTKFEEIKTTVSTKLNATKETITNIFNNIKSTVTSIINNIKNSVSTVFENIKSSISTKLNSAKTTVTNIFNSIKTTISNVINNAKTTVSNGLNAIKGFFDRLVLKLPKIKLPHFSISGSFSLDPPSIPKIGVEWYKKGGVLNEATAFGVNPQTGALRVGGEAGAEAVAPIDTLMGYVKTAVKEETNSMTYTMQRLIDMLADYFPEILNKMNQNIVLDDGTLVGRIAPKMNMRLNDIQTANARGR